MSNASFMEDVDTFENVGFSDLIDDTNIDNPQNIIEFSPRDSMDTNNSLATEIEVTDEELPKKRRGRPKKTDDSSNEETQKKRTIKIEDLPEETIMNIYQQFSKKDIDEISSELNLDTILIKNTIKRLKKLFESEVANGSITQESFDASIAPKLIQFKVAPKPIGLRKIINNIVTEINKS